MTWRPDEVISSDHLEQIMTSGIDQFATGQRVRLGTDEQHLTGRLGTITDVSPSRLAVFVDVDGHESTGTPFRPSELTIVE